MSQAQQAATVSTAGAPLKRGLLLAFTLPTLVLGITHGPEGQIQAIYAKHAGIALTAIALAVLLTKLFDAITYPLIGYWSDRTYARSGSRKSWVIAGTIASALGVWFLWGFFKSMPFELEEAAMVDGCTRLGAFLRVVLPLSLPGLITVAIFSFLLSWTDYTFALIMIGSDANKTLPVGLASMVGSFDLRWGEIMAGSTLIALPLFAAFALLTQYFIQGLGAGAVKG